MIDPAEALIRASARVDDGVLRIRVARLGLAVGRAPDAASLRAAAAALRAASVELDALAERLP